MKLIGLAGRARSGKSSIAEHLTAHYGYVQLAFADPIRETIEYALNTPAEYIEVHKETPIPPHGKSYRELAQTLGDWGRGLRPDFWVLDLERRLNELRDYSTYELEGVVISDVRFINEAQWVRERGQLWHITRPGQDPSQTREHSSELGIEPMDGEVLICNSETLDDLCDHVDYLLASRFTSP